MFNKRLLLVLCAVLASLLLVWGGVAGLSYAAPSTPRAAGTEISVLYRFEPASQTFFTVSLPGGAKPFAVVVTGTAPTRAWFTEPERDLIGQLVFTTTTDYALTEYPLAANSQPYFITVSGTEVWFTERGSNQVGRLSLPTGQVDVFGGHGLPSNAGLAGVVVAPDNSVWVAGQFAKRLYRLVITSPADYAFQEYPTRPPNSRILGSADPFGIDIVVINPPASYQIAFAAPMSNSIGLLTPGSNEVLISSGIPPAYAPTAIVYDASRDSVWFTEPGGGALGLSFKGTLGTSPRQFLPLARPVFLTHMVNNTLWVSQQDGVGQLGQFVYSGSGSHQFTSYPLPLAGARPNGVALADDGNVWLAAYETQRLFLPIIRR